MKSSLLSIAVVSMFASTSALAYNTIDLSVVANTQFNNSGFINGATFPTASIGDGSIVTLDGVPYLLPSTGNYMWLSELAAGSNPRQGDIGVNIFGVDVAYTLMGTYWGENATGTYASIEFFGDAGGYYIVDLDGGSHIRDYNYNPSYTVTLDPNVAKEVWNNGAQHIDRQMFDLPDAFNSQTLTSIRVSDNGGNSFQRTFVAAVTVSPVPEPGTYAMMLAGLSLLGLGVRRQRVK